MACHRRSIRQLRHELALIGGLDYAPYFLTVNSIVRYARSKGILCQGRGSAANSAVCYVLGVTAIDPVRSGLLFERFISAERREPPDIDVDFESERREEVIQWVYERYGRDRAALCATAMCFGPRGAIRDVGKVMGLTEDVTGLLASQVWGWSDDGVLEEHAAELNLNLADRRLRLSITLARELIGFPRQLGTHPGGFVLTRDRLDELVPVEPAAMAGRQVIEWDKDDIDALKFMKVDVLGPGHAGLPAPRLRDAGGAPGRVGRHRHHPAGGPAHVRDDPQGGHAGHLPDREPGTDGHAAAAEAHNLLRLGRAGRDRAARPDPGRHGASLPAAARRAGSCRYTRSRN